MKKEKVVGILGGLGPEATLRLFQVILEKTPASSDQDHLHLIIDNNPKIPERLPAILGTGPDPVPMMVASGQALERAGADFIIIPCVSAHYFLPELSRRLSLPIISMLDEAAVRIKAFKPQIKKVGLLAAEGTMRVGLFQNRLMRDVIETIIPEGGDRAEVQANIFKIKDTRARHDRKEISMRIHELAERMIVAGAQGILIGCTEISTVMDPGSFSVPGFDALTILGQAAIHKAGLTPI
jgi:aspartate racemase